eukprot:12157471-Prorocentrum_lima.AAC.1
MLHGVHPGGLRELVREPRCLLDCPQREPPIYGGGLPLTTPWCTWALTCLRAWARSSPTSSARSAS